MTKRSLLLSTAIVAALSVAGCSSAPSRVTGPYTGGGQATARDVEASRKRTVEAKERFHEDPAAAEFLLREALDLDVYNGVAHNNLGVIFLDSGKLYEAVQEFEAARKLMPGNPDPRTNLAIALERAGRISDAVEAARSALESQSDYLPALQALAAIQVTSGQIDDKTSGVLAAIAERSPEAVWRDWATMTRLKIEGRSGLRSEGPSPAP